MTPGLALPSAAVAAAIASSGEHTDTHLWLTAAEGTAGGLLARRELLMRALLAAAPLIAAAERTRIRQMAQREQAVCTGSEGTQCYFADLLDPETT